MAAMCNPETYDAAPVVEPSHGGDSRIAHPFKGGRVAEKNVSSPEGTTESLPQISFVIFDMVFSQQGEEFLLETHFAMMFFLVFDVADDSVQLRKADTKGAI